MDLTGQVTEQIDSGLADRPKSDDVVETLTWHALYPELCGYVGASPCGPLLEAILALDVMHDPAAAAAALEKNAAVALGPLSKWIGTQIAIADHDTAAFEKFAAGELSAHESALTWALFHAISHGPQSLLSSVLHPDVFKQGGQGQSWPLRHAAELALVTAEQWSDFAQLLQGGDLVDQVILAHVLGERLADRQERVRALSELSSEAELYRIEALFEIAWLDGDADLLEQVLRQRWEILSKLSGATAYAAATAALLQARSRDDGQMWTMLDNAADKSAAWDHLQGLFSRRNRAVSRSELAQSYLDQLSFAPPHLVEVWRLRAAELWMAEGQWQRAIDVLPKDAKQHYVMAASRRYRSMCLAHQQAWADLANELLGLRSSLPPEEYGSAIKLALIFACRDLDKAENTVRQIEAIWSSLPDDEMMELAAYLLASCRKFADYAACARLWRELSERFSGQSEQVIFTFGMGVVLSNSGHADQAVTAFEVVELQTQKEPWVVLGATVARLLTQDWTRSVAGYELFAQMLPVEPQKLILRRTAQLAWATIDPHRALELLISATSGDGQDPQVFKELASLQLGLGQVAEAVVALRKAALVTSNKQDAVETFCLIGALARNRLSDMRSAEQAFKDALNLDPHCLDALQGLREIFAYDGRNDELAEVLNAMVSVVSTDTDKLKIYLDLSWIYRKKWERLGDESFAQRCIDECDRIFALNPSHEDAIKNLSHVCLKLGRWDEVISRLAPCQDSELALRSLRRAYEATKQWAQLSQCCIDLAQMATSSEDAFSAWMQAADVNREKIHDVIAAETCYRHAAAQGEAIERRVALDRLAQILRDAGRVDELAQILSDLVSLTAGDETLSLRQELGALYAERLNVPQEAVAQYEQILAVEPTHWIALTTLDTLYEKLDRPADQARVLERIAQQVDGTDGALQVLLRWHLVCQRIDDAKNLLRIASKLHHGFIDQDVAFQVSETVYERQNRYHELIDLYQKRSANLDAAQSNDQDNAVVIASLWRRIGEIQQKHLPDAEASAVDSYSKALDYHPDDENVLAMLVALLGKLNDWQRLLLIYERQANRCKDKKKQIAHLHRAALVAQKHLGDEAETVRIYQRIHSLDPADSVSFAVLEKRLERQNDLKKLVSLLLDRAQTVTARNEELDCVLRAAAICEKIPEVEQSIKLYQRALSINPAGISALEALARIYESLERWKDLLTVTSRQIQFETESSRKALLYFKCGSVMETQFGDEKEAFRYYTEAVKTSITCLPALHSLRDFYARHEEWHKVAETLAAEARVWSDPKGKADVLAQLAEVHATRLSNRSQAMEYYKQAIQINPKCMPAAYALFDAYMNQGDYAEATVWGDVYARRGTSRGSHTQRADFYVRWADVLRRVGRISEAVEAYLQALETRPGLPTALHGLLALCRSHPDVFDYSHAFNELIRSATARDDAAAIAVLSTASGVLAEHRGDLDSALDLYQRALDIGGEQIATARPLADLLLRIGKDREALELVQRCRDAAFENSEWIDASVWIAEYFVSGKSDPKTGAGCYRDILGKHPNAEGIRAQLAKTLMLQGDFGAAHQEWSQVCDSLAMSGSDVDRLGRSFHSLALSAFSSGNLAAAESNWRRSCDLLPSYPYSYLGLAKAMWIKGATQDAERELRLAEQSTDEMNPDVLRMQASFYAKSNHLDRAVSLVKRLARAPSSELDDRVPLARLYILKGEPQRAVEELRAVLAATPDYLPAYDGLVTALAAAGATALSTRAARVVQFMEGVTSSSSKKDIGIFSSVTVTGWQRVIGEYFSAPIDEIWFVIADRVATPKLEDDDSLVPVLPEVSSLFKKLTQMCGVSAQIRRGDDYGPLVSVADDQVFVSPELDKLNNDELTPFLLVALAARRLGFGPLLNTSPDHRKSLARLAATLLQPDGARPTEANTLYGELGRKEQKRIAKAATMLRVGQENIEHLSSTWLRQLDESFIRMALLFSDDFSATAKMIALQRGYWSADMSTVGLLVALPELQVLAQYYLSDQFHNLRSSLSAA